MPGQRQEVRQRDENGRHLPSGKDGEVTQQESGSTDLVGKSHMHYC